LTIIFAPPNTKNISTFSKKYFTKKTNKTLVLKLWYIRVEAGGPKSGSMFDYSIHLDLVILAIHLVFIDMAKKIIIIIKKKKKVNLICFRAK